MRKPNCGTSKGDNIIGLKAFPYHIFFSTLHGSKKNLALAQNKKNQST